MIVLGIDPGLVCTGVGAINSESGQVELIEAGTIRPPTKHPLEQRLRVLHESLAATLDRVRPDVVCVEEIYSKYAHPRTAILMGHARGCLLLAAGERDIEVTHYAATRVKSALTGSGRASKDQVQLMVTQLLELPEPPRPNDITDALALALCHANLTSRELPHPL